MALINNAQKSQQRQSTQSQATDGNSEAVTPAQQANYDKLVMAGLKVIYDKSTHDSIVNMLRSGGDPSEALANTVSTIMLQLDKKSGGRVPEEIILPAAAELLGEVSQLAGKIGIQVDERVTGQAMQRMVMSLADEYGVSPEDVKTLIDSVGPQEAQKMAQQQSAFNQPSPSAAPTPTVSAAPPTAPSAPAQPGG